MILGAGGWAHDAPGPTAGDSAIPRYFVDTDDGFLVRDEEGHHFPDAETLRRTVRHALTEMIRGIDGYVPAASASAVVRDETGRCVMRATLTLVVQDGE